MNVMKTKHTKKYKNVYLFEMFVFLDRSIVTRHNSFNLVELWPAESLCLLQKRLSRAILLHNNLLKRSATKKNGAM